jgi:hypothetical protein
MVMNWYKESQKELSCEMTLEEFELLSKHLESEVLWINFLQKNKKRSGALRPEVGSSGFQESLLKWSRCIRVLFDPIYNSTLHASIHNKRILTYIAYGTIVVEIPETFDNISKWHGAACMAYLSEISKLFHPFRDPSRDPSTFFVERMGENWQPNYFNVEIDDTGSELTFLLADKESLDRVLEFTKTPEYNSGMATGSWVIGVMKNPNTPHGLQKKIVDDFKKNKERLELNLRGYLRDNHLAMAFESLMCNPNGSPDVMKSILSGDLAHSNSTLVGMIEENESVFGLILGWRSALGLGLKPNESVLQVVSEYINKIISEWHSRYFDLRGRPGYSWRPGDPKEVSYSARHIIMDLVMWMNFYSKNPETLRRNLDTTQKAMLLKEIPNDENTPLKNAQFIWDPFFPYSLKRDLITSFIMRQSELKDEEVQQLIEIKIKEMFDDMYSRNWSWKKIFNYRQSFSFFSDIFAQKMQRIGELWKFRFGGSYDERKRCFGPECEDSMKILINKNKQEFLKSFDEAFKRFDFKKWMEEFKKNQKVSQSLCYTCPHNLMSPITSLQLYSVRLAFVRSWTKDKGISDDLV